MKLIYKIKDLDSAYRQNEIVCDKMKEIAKENGISGRKKLSGKFTAMNKLFKEGKISERQFNRFRNKFLRNQYYQGFIMGVKFAEEKEVAQK